MKKFTPISWLKRPLSWGLYILLASSLASCSTETIPIGPTSLNSRYTEQQPALSGDGRFLALVSNRNGTHQVLIYDLQRQIFIPTPGLNRPSTVAESPSLSYTGRYIAYLTTDQGRPVIALYDRATQQSQIVTPTYRGWVRHPSISPDGRYIAFESAGRGQWDVEVLDRGPTVELDIPNGAPINPPPGGF